MKHLAIDILQTKIKSLNNENKQKVIDYLLSLQEGNVSYVLHSLSSSQNKTHKDEK